MVFSPIFRRRLGWQASLDLLSQQNDEIISLLEGIFLQDSEVATDILQLQGLAEKRPFTAQATIAATSTGTPLTLSVPSGYVGLITQIRIDVTISYAIDITVTIDGNTWMSESGAISREIKPARVWLPVFNELRVDATNNDVATQTVTVTGLRTFLDADKWEDIRSMITRSLGFALSM